MPSVHVVKAVSQLRVLASYAAFLWWQFPSWEDEGLPDVNIWIALTSDRHVNGDDWRSRFQKVRTSGLTHTWLRSPYRQTQSAKGGHVIMKRCGPICRRHEYLFQTKREGFNSTDIFEELTYGEVIRQVDTRWFINFAFA